MDVVIRPEDVDVVPVEKGMLSGKVFSVTFKGDYYEIIVDVAGFKWMLETSDYVGEGQVIGLRIEPDAIHVMKRSKFSDTFGDFSTFSEEMEHLSDVTGRMSRNDQCRKDHRTHPPRRTSAVPAPCRGAAHYAGGAVHSWRPCCSCCTSLSQTETETSRPITSRRWGSTAIPLSLSIAFAPDCNGGMPADRLPACILHVPHLPPHP